MSLTEQIIALATDHPALIGLIIFASTFAEAIVVVGAVVPGAALVIVLSGIVGAARGAILPLILWALAGALIGDGIAYWIGRRYGPHLRERWPFRLKPDLFDRGARFFQKHGAKSLVIGRFVPGLRAFTPVAAGMLGMKPTVFFPASIIAALAWAIVHIVPAAAAGVLLSAVGRISSRLVAAVVAFVVIFAVAIWLARLAVNIVGPALTTGYARAVAALVRSRSPVWRRVGLLLDPTVANITAHILWGLVLIVCAIGVLGIVQDVVAGDPLVQADAAIRQFTQSFRAGPVDKLMVVISAFGNTVTIAISAAALVAALFFGGARRTAAIVATVFAVTIAVIPLMDLAFDQHRPVELIPEFAAFSFPSSHATLVALFCGVVAVLLGTGLGAAGRVVTWAVGFLLATLVGISRVYLDAQWPSDVVAGLLLGLALTAVFAMIRNGFQDEVGDSPQIPIMAFAAFLAAGAVTSSITFESDLARAAPKTSVTVLSPAEWMDGGWKRLPQRRIDLFGETEEPVFMQAAVDPAAITLALTRAGWTETPAFSPTDFLYFLVPAAPLESFPPLPLLHGGRVPEMSFIRPSPDPEKRLAFRLWASDFVVRTAAGDTPIFVGAVTEEKVSHPYDALTVLSDRPAPSVVVHQARIDAAGIGGASMEIAERPGTGGQIILVGPKGP
jgi:undecaprenyl-diphosphatase